MTKENAIHRMRRLRLTPGLRGLVQENRLHPQELILPVFVNETLSEPQPVKSMPGVVVQTLDSMPRLLDDAQAVGVTSFLFFGIPEQKDGVATQAYADTGIVQRALRVARKAVDDSVVLIADTCVCEYTDHGHCGPLGLCGETSTVANDASCELLTKTAVSQAEAGADLIAPSAMMDGQVAAIRGGLDAAGYTHIPVMSYSAKMASSFYGPFRDAAESAPSQGDRKSYQMDPANSREALRESALDIDEGADMLMVKPAGPCLDIIALHRLEFDLPLAAYQVSGEMAMIEAAAANGWLNRDACVMESLMAIKRAGASPIITYYAMEVAGWLKRDA